MTLAILTTLTVLALCSYGLGYYRGRKEAMIELGDEAIRLRDAILNMEGDG